MRYFWAMCPTCGYRIDGILQWNEISIIIVNTDYRFIRLIIILNPFKTKLVQIIFKNSAHTSKRTPHFTITKINLLTLFKEIIAVYTENHTRPINTKWRVTDW
jgi:hypothetical protein